MPPLITETRVEDLLRQPMTASGRVRWRQKRGWWEATIPVSHPDPGVRLRLIITVNDRIRSKASVSLLLDGGYRIRGLDLGGSHENKHTDRNVWYHQVHKHKWTDACRGAWAYTPAEISNDVSLEQAFLLFCAECGIEFRGTWHDPPPVQTRIKRLW